MNLIANHKINVNFPLHNNFASWHYNMQKLKIIRNRTVNCAVSYHTRDDDRFCHAQKSVQSVTKIHLKLM